MKLYIIILISLISMLQTYAQIPSSYDLRNVNGNNYVSSVKSQQGGNSWTYAVCASAESNLMISGNWANAGESGEPDLAEYHIDWWNGFNSFNNDDIGGANTGGFAEHSGGNFSMAEAYLTRGEGFVRNIDGQSYNTPPERYNAGFRFWSVKEIERFTIDDALNGIDSIKTKIMQKGAAAGAICWDSSFIDNDFNFYQPSSSNLAANHAVVVVGWDDAHSVPAATGNGAWLVKNCWGTSWGNSGYFWVSYFDKYLFKTEETAAYFFSGIDTSAYDIIYFYDYHGRQDTLTLADSIFNKFHAKENVRLKTAGFYTESENTDYVIKVYGRFADGELSDLKLTTSGTILHKGFHTVNLPGDIPINNGDDFYVMLSLSDKKYAYDRTSNINLTYGGKSSKNVIESAALPDESYYSQTGQWNDFYDYTDPSGFNNSGNFCLKIKAAYNTNIGINEFNKHIRVYPNPAKDYIFCDVLETGIFSIYDISGKLILSKKINNTGSIDISGFKKGIYFLKTETGKGIYFEKILKQ